MDPLNTGSDDATGIIDNDYAITAEKPLSPVLNSGTGLHRRHLMKNKSKSKKTRLNLCELFGNEPKPSCSTESNRPQIDQLGKISLASTNALNCSTLDKLDEIERNRKCFYDLFTSADNNQCFKMPTPLALAGKTKKSKENLGVNRSNTGDVDELFFEEEEIPVMYNATPVKLNKSIGFQTAGGKNIEVQDEHFQKQFELFGDILQVNKIHCKQRQNKYNFLSRSQSDIQQDSKDTEHRDIFYKEMSDTQLIMGVEKIISENQIGLNSSIHITKNKNYVKDFLGFTETEVSLSSELHRNFCAFLLSKSVCDVITEENIELGNRGIKRPLEAAVSPKTKRTKRSSSDLTCEYQLTVLRTDSMKMLHKDCDEKFKGFAIQEGRDLCCRGFSTASGGRLKVSEESLMKAVEIVKEVDSQLYQTNSLDTIKVETNAKTSNKPKFSDCQLDIMNGQKSIKTTEFTTNTTNNVDEIRSEIAWCKPADTKTSTFQYNSSLKGFSTASGKKVTISDKALARANQVFNDIELELAGDQKPETDPSNMKNRSTSSSFSCASGKSLRVSKANLKNAKAVLFKDINEDLSGVSKETVQELKKSQVEEAPCTEKNTFTSSGFTSASEKALKFSEAGIDLEVRKKWPEPNTSSVGTKLMSCGFSCASGKSLKVSETNLEKARNVFKELSDSSKEMYVEIKKNQPEATTTPNVGSKFISSGFSCASGKSLKVSEANLKNAKAVFKDIAADLPDTSKELDASKDNENMNKDVKNEESVARLVSKNKLKALDEAIRNIEHFNGDNYSEQEDMLRKQALNRLMQSKTQNSPVHVNSKTRRISETSNYRASTPVKLLPNTPILGSKSNNKKRLGISSCQQIPISEAKLLRAKQLFSEEFVDISPIKPPTNFNNYNSTKSFHNSSTPIPDRSRRTNNIVLNNNNFDTPKKSENISGVCNFSKLVVVQAEPGNNTLSLNHYDSSVVIASPTKGDVLEQAKDMEEECKKLEQKLSVMRERMKQLGMVMDKKKDAEDKRPLPGILYRRKTIKDRIILRSLENRRNIENKESLWHINPKNAEYVHFKESTSFLSTQDGATIIPNKNDLIGINEIEHGFQLMPGTDPTLIPKGWLRNHYKWIVWKLASYERQFPDQFDGVLNVENIIQQLKYRYDREIDKAERSALRRIYEKDDAPQKRMILCVSDIEMTKRELELTDGWYSIRTVIDEPLYAQVLYGRIEIGTKLIASGAELLNCDGCHPLESTDMTCLRIHFNCTRRAAWYTKLGYQIFPGPFVIRIDTVHPLGGPIGAIKIVVLRVYPIRYLEKCDNKASVWRNAKAEERVAQAWENEQIRKMEKIQESARDKLDQLHRSNKNNNLLSNQEEINVTAQEQIDKLKVKRNVTPVLRLLVLDNTISEFMKHYNFLIWNPSEFHLEMLKENSAYSVFNVLPRTNGDLCSTSKTTFNLESKNCDKSNTHSTPSCYNRRVIPIEELSMTNVNATNNFQEFDCVGLVLRTLVEETRQEVLLCGCRGSLLLVRIHEGPSTCALIDNLKKLSVISACNLNYKRSRNSNISEAIANHSTIFSCYPQHRHLQSAMEAFKSECPKDLESILIECDERIEAFEHRQVRRMKIESSSGDNWDDSDEDVLSSSRLTSTDVALSLIDVDQFL